MKTLVVLPARHDSTRLPGKPMADICGKPMIQRSYENARKQCDCDVIVATDSDVIARFCAGARIPWTMTSSRHPTGTDRCAEVASKLTGYDVIVNYQPDEPLLGRGVIQTIIDATVQTEDVTCGMAPILDPRDVASPSVGKVVTDRHGVTIYISRSPIPYGQTVYMTQVCVYGFMRDDLLRFAELPQSPLEKSEGIELLRWIETGAALRMIRVPGERLAVDTPEDLERIRRIVSERERCPDKVAHATA